MRHLNKINALGRTYPHRKSMLANMGSSLLKNDKKRVITTLAKARELRRFIEPLITRAKENSTHNRRIVFSHLRDKEAVSTLFSEVAAAVSKRAGGYTRILKLGPRKGDNAEMALIELVDFNEFLKETKKKSRRRPAAKKATTKTTKAVEAAESKIEAPAVEESSNENPPATEGQE